jgi:AMP-binding enzyme
VELGVTTAANIEVDLPRADMPQQTVTEHILALAGRAGYRAALIDAGDATVTTWPQFAHTVRTAARGLSRHGLRATDTAGVFVQDAASHAVAMHAVRAAGAVAVPVPAAATMADVAAHLKACRARLLITSAPLAELAIQAAERSWVRQVFAFGDAAGTTSFDSLLEAARHGHHHNGSTGPDGGTWSAPDDAEAPESSLTCRDVVVAAPPCGEGNAYTALVDLALAAGATIVAAPVARVTAAVQTYKGTAAIVPCGTEVPGLPAERVFTVG